MCEVANYQDVFVRNVKNLMIKHKLNQYTLAEKVGVSQTGLRLILVGESNPTLKTITAICDAFNVSIGDMFNPNEDQFGEQVSKEEEILELKQELIRKDVKIDGLHQKIRELSDGVGNQKVQISMIKDNTSLKVNGLPVEFKQINELNIYNKTIEVVLKFDELSVK